MYVNLFMNLNYLVQFLFYCVKKAGQSNTQYKSLLECGNAGTCIYMIKKKATCMQVQTSFKYSFNVFIRPQKHLNKGTT